MWLTEREEEPFWSFQDLAIFLGLALPCLLGGSLVVKGVFAVFSIHTSHKGLELLPGQFLGYALLFTALAWLLRLEYERPFWRSLGWRAPYYPLIGIVGSGSAVALGIALLGAALKAPPSPEPMRELLNDRASLIAVAIFGVTFGPICEELAFRGFMQPLFMRAWGVAPGIFASALGFGLLHLPQYGLSWQHGILITLAGAAFGWMRWISGSTLGATIMHSAYNLTLFVGFFAAGNDVHQPW